VQDHDIARFHPLLEFSKGLFQRLAKAGSCRLVHLACVAGQAVEQVRVEREPITDTNLDAATSGPEISEEEHEVVLREEEPVVEKRVVPKERVRLDKDTVTGEERVAEELRKEQIDVQNEDRTGERQERRRRR